MRKYFIIIFLFSFSNIFSQCIPDTSLLNSPWGLWPDTVQNLPHAVIAYNYNTTIQLKTPTTVDEVVAQPVSVGGLTLDLTGWPVDSMQLVNVIGLPTGLTYNCNNTNCSWLGNDVGCIDISGIPTAGGTYDLIFQIDGFITMGAMGVMSVSGATGAYLDYTGYQIIVDTCLPNSSIDSVTSCDDYTWNGTTYTASGIYDYLTTNVGGCDSTATLNLTINNSNTSTTIIADCDSYTWIDGNIYTASNNTATHTLTNTLGCDSVVTLNLTILNSNTSTTTVTACDDYTWNGVFYNASGTYTYNTLNVTGCDSIATLNLTIVSGAPSIDIFSSVSPPSSSNCPHVCLGDSIVFEVDTGFVSYNWNTGDTTDRIVVYPQGNMTYVVEALDSMGCEARDTICVEIWQTSINIVSSVSPPTGSDCPHVCFGDSIVFEANTGFAYYVWNTGQIADTTHRVVVYPQGNMTYVVESIDNISGCEVRDTICVEIWQSPPLLIASVPDPPVICAGDTLILEASSGFMSYSWNVGPVCTVCNTMGCICNPSSCTCTPTTCSCGGGNTGHIFIDDPIQDTWYLVEAIDSNGCAVLEDINVIVDSCSTSINNFSSDIIIYPNPLKDKFNLIIDNLYNYNKLQILNPLGNCIYSDENLESNMIVDLSANKAGIYYLVLSGDNNRVVRKIILSK